MAEPPQYRFYDDLAAWWPLISSPADYAEEAAFAATLLRPKSGPAREVLELGSGGGNNASHLKSQFSMTLVDLSDAMLEVSRSLNPECEHHQGDMRSIRLHRTFDAVFVHDAIDYMVTETDLRTAVETVFVHCRPGGVAVIVPDDTTETFEPSTDHGGHDGEDGRGVRYLEWSWRPDGEVGRAFTDYVFLFRQSDGSTRTAHERHVLGLFPRAHWMRALEAAGFEVEAVGEVTEEDRAPRTFFVGRRPV
jgi:SAM-dependent methyltransferase